MDSCRRLLPNSAAVLTLFRAESDVILPSIEPTEQMMDNTVAIDLLMCKITTFLVKLTQLDSEFHI